MGNSIKLRATLDGTTTEVKAIIKHSMETGLRKDSKTGELVPAHFIQEVVCELNGKPVMTAEWGGAVSANPYISFQFEGAKAGDSVTLSWKDNKDGSDSAETQIKG